MEWLVSGEGEPEGGQPLAQMLGRFKAVGEMYHPDDIAGQEGLIDVLSDAVAPLIVKMSERKGDAISEPDENKSGRKGTKAPTRVPVVGWAHAGHAASYEELPIQWQETVPTDCRDPRAFSIVLEGNSMEPIFRDGDQLVVMPSEVAHSGCYAVCRFLNDSFVFRRVEIIGDSIRLAPLNDKYEATTHNRAEFSWIYPIWERRSRHWKS